MGIFKLCYNDTMSQLPDELNIDGQKYESVSDEVRVATIYLLRARDKLGLTDKTVLAGTVENSYRINQVIRKYAFEVYKVWAALYPRERAEFIVDTEHDLTYERSVKDAVKAGGYSPIAYPTRLDQMYHILIPGVKTQDKRFWIPLLKQIPELRRTNYLR